MNNPYDYEIPIPPFHPMLPHRGVYDIKAVDGRGFKTDRQPDREGRLLPISDFGAKDCQSVWGNSRRYFLL